MLASLLLLSQTAGPKLVSIFFSCHDMRQVVTEEEKIKPEVPGKQRMTKGQPDISVLSSQLRLCT